MSETRGVADDNPDAGASITPMVSSSTRPSSSTADEERLSSTNTSANSPPVRIAVDRVRLMSSWSSTAPPEKSGRGSSDYPRARPYSPVGPAPLELRSPPMSDAGDDTTDDDAPLRWWVEIGLTVAFYVVYSAIRNQFGSALGDSVRGASFRNAERIIDIERAMGLYVEEGSTTPSFRGTGSCLLERLLRHVPLRETIGAMVLLFARHPERYTFMRSTLAATAGVALVGFAFFLMPPRLLGNCASVRGVRGRLRLHRHPGRSRRLWSFESGTMETISNQYAAMPSLHIAWAIWCTVALYPVLRRRWARPDRDLPDPQRCSRSLSRRITSGLMPSAA